MVRSTQKPLATVNEDLLSWTVFGPKLLSRLPRNRTMSYHFRFLVKNHTGGTLQVKVLLESPSPILVIREAKSKHLSKSRLYAEITMLSHTIEQQIPPGKELNFTFRADYAPQLTRPLPSVLTLYYGIFAYDLRNQIKIRYGPRKIALPIAGRSSSTPPVDDYTI